MTTGPNNSSAADEAEHLRAELENLARARDLIKLDPSQYPKLRALCGDNSGMDEIHSLISHAAESLSAREASAVAILLSDSDQRWQRTLRERMSEAGQLLGISSYNTFRDRSGESGKSAYDIFLLKVAAEVAKAAKRNPASFGRPGGSSVGSGPKISQLLVAATVAFMAVLGVAAYSGFAGKGTDSAAAGGNDRVVVPTTERDPAIAGPSEASGAGPSSSIDSDGMSSNRGTDITTPVGVSITGCNIPLGAPMSFGGAPDNLGELVEKAFLTRGGLESVGCPSHTIQPYHPDLDKEGRFGSLWAQEFDGTPVLEPGSIIVDPATGQAIWVYQNLADGYFDRVGGAARVSDGFPSEVNLHGPNPVMELEGGGIVIGHSLDGPAMYIPSPAMAVWEAEGGYNGTLGLPMTDVNFRNGKLTQDFEHGFMRQDGPAMIVFEVVPETDAAQAATAVQDQLPGILEGYDGTAWWIDESGDRYYIPSGDVRECLGGNAAVIEKESPGWVTSQFGYKARIECP